MKPVSSLVTGVSDGQMAGHARGRAVLVSGTNLVIRGADRQVPRAGFAVLDRSAE